MKAYINHRKYWTHLGQSLVFGIVGLLTFCSLFLCGCATSYPDYDRPPLIVDYQKMGHDKRPKSIPRDEKGVPDYNLKTQLKAPETGPNYYYVHDPSNPRSDKDGFVRVSDAIVDKAVNTKALPVQAGDRFSNNIGSSPTVDTSVGQKNSTKPTPKPTISKVSITPTSAVPPSNAMTKQTYPGPAASSDMPTLTNDADKSSRDDHSNQTPVNTELVYNQGNQAVMPNQHQTGEVSAPNNKAVLVSNTSPITTAAEKLPTNATDSGPSGNNSGQLTQPVAPKQVATDNTPVSIENAITYLERLINLSPDNIDAQIALRLLYSSYGNTDKAMRQLAALPGQKQDELLTLARATVLAAKFWRDPDNPAVANGARDAIRRLSDEISDKADLSISRLKICRPPSPDGSTAVEFGKYVELPKADLETGSPQMIQVYCELENFKYQQNAQGKYFTKLHADITIYDALYNPVVQPLSADVEDAPLFNKRRDFFLRAVINLPQLSPGKYEIVVIIEDKTAGKRALPARYRFEVKPGQKNTASTDR